MTVFVDFELSASCWRRAERAPVDRFTRVHAQVHSDFDEERHLPREADTMTLAGSACPGFAGVEWRRARDETPAAEPGDRR
jgi:hypothetical protein